MSERKCSKMDRWTYQHLKMRDWPPMYCPFIAIKEWAQGQIPQTMGFNPVPCGKRLHNY